MSMEGEKSKKKSLASPLSLPQFVSITSPLLDLEKEAEISASISSGSSRSLDTAQKRGSSILNLKCVDAQTGLMGKTLLEFQSTKGDVLPAHKEGEAPAEEAKKSNHVQRKLEKRQQIHLGG